MFEKRVTFLFFSLKFTFFFMLKLNNLMYCATVLTQIQIELYCAFCVSLIVCSIQSKLEVSGIYIYDCMPSYPILKMQWGLFLCSKFY